MRAATAVELDALPGPRRLPWLGNAHQLRTSRLHLILEDMAARYGPVYRIDIGPDPVVVFSDREAINAILRRRPDDFRRNSVMTEVVKETGSDGVFAAEGDAWRRQRRLAVTALNADHLHRFYAVISLATERLHRRLQAAARAGAPVDIHEPFQAYAVDVTSALAFGHDLNTLERGDVELQGHIHRVFDMTARRSAAPVAYWRRCRLPADRALDRSVAALQEAIAGFIAEARERLAARPDRPPENFLESMLAAPEAYSDHEIAGNVQTMLTAGEDTTSHSLAWAVWYLARRPDVQARLAAEARDLQGADPVPGYEAAAQAHYGEAVLREAIRLRSAAPIMFVEAAQDTEVGGVRLPAGTRLMLMTRLVATQESSYVNATAFDPGRWLEPDAAPDPKGLLAFGAGPRFCPGRNLAFLEAKAALAMLAHAFEITPDPAAPPVRERFGFTMGPTAVPVLLRERAPALAGAPA